MQKTFFHQLRSALNSCKTPDDAQWLLKKLADLAELERLFNQPTEQANDQ